MAFFSIFFSSPPRLRSFIKNTIFFTFLLFSTHSTFFKLISSRYFYHIYIISNSEFWKITLTFFFVRNAKMFLSRKFEFPIIESICINKRGVVFFFDVAQKKYERKIVEGGIIVAKIV